MWQSSPLTLLSKLECYNVVKGEPGTGGGGGGGATKVPLKP
jgi:hypothetical protein